MKIKFNSDDELRLNKAIEILTMTLVVSAIFLENNKYYPQVQMNVCIKYENEKQKRIKRNWY